MVNAFSNITQDKQEIKYQLSANHPSVSPAAKLFPESIEVIEVVTRYDKLTLDGTTLVWGSTVQGDWGDYNWGSSPGTTSLYAVIPRNDTYIEYFGQNNYIDTGNSTGTLDISAETYTIDTGEILQSAVVGKYQRGITGATLTTGLSNVTLQVSNDSGSNWYTVSDGVLYSFASNANTNELKYKITATANVVISNPIQIQVFTT